MLYIEKDTMLEGVFEKLPKAFLGLLIGITFGGIGGAIFDDMGFVSSLPWEEIFIFLGALFGLIIGYKDE
jgi:hypothetical protein